TIQDAVDAAVNGDHVVVAPGTWTGTGNNVVDLLGKSIQVSSSVGADVTIIDGQNQRRGVHFSGGETADTVLKGFTITNGVGTGSFFEGGGIRCAAGASPTITDCIITGNMGWRGPGLMLHGDATVTDCQVSDNNSPDNTSVNSYGGGIYCLADAVITNCDISDNGSYWGAGMTLQDCDAQVVDCTMSGNSAVQGGAVYVRSQSPTFLGCSLHGNNAGYGGAVYLYTDSSPMFVGCSMHDNVSAGFAGAVAAYLAGPAIFDNCTIRNNLADGSGGAFWIYFSMANMEITNCAITSNECVGTGGAIYSDLGIVTLADSLVCDNTLDQVTGLWTDGGGNTISEVCVVGACCDGSDCSLLTQVECDAIPGSTWLGDGSTCDDCLAPDEGACCLQDGLRGGACTITDPVSCEAIGGDWQGSGTDCTACIPPPQPGACCLVGGCTLLWQDICLSIGGNWLGNDTSCDTCPEPGACCLPTGCLQSWEQDCIAAGGDWYVGALCDDCPPAPEPGACCFGCGVCFQTLIDDCDVAGGTWLGVGEDCADCPPPCIGDTNGDDVVDILDLMNVIGYWGLCP
ncbi:MAG: right-handed parallel beta-helix repeat-containing protein, partial [Phycisphaerales bacterium]|nr:right-handed parallel beta-helix repeat-containing protein [Phycisphaerales bacterium]